MKEKTFVLGMGAQKAATSWLRTFLHQQERANFGFCKEYHVWDFRDIELFAHHQVAWADVFRSKTRCFQRLMRHSPWLYFRYFQYCLRDSEMTGDITPTYCGLSHQVLRKIRGEFQKKDIRVKAIFIARDPVDRCLSAFQMECRDHPQTGEDQHALNQRFRERIHSAGYQIRTQYQETLKNMSRAFEPEAYLVGFYEHLSSGGLSQQLCDFLGLEPDAHMRETVINSSPKITLSEEVLAECRATYEATYAYFYERFPETRAIWAH